MWRTLIALFVIAAFGTGAASASTNAEEAPETARAPAAAMKLLADMEGDWTTTVKFQTESGEWKMQSVNRVRVASHLDGLLLTEEELERIEGDQTSPRLKVDYTYDQYRNVYRISAVDSGWGIMDIYEGALDDGDLILTNIRADTNFPLDDGGALHFQLRIPVTGDEKIMQVLMSTDRGASWRPFYQIVYTRTPG